MRQLCPDGLLGYVVDGGDGGRAEDVLVLAAVNELEQASPNIGVRFPGKQHVEYHVGVEEHLHRYFSSR